MGGELCKVILVVVALLFGADCETIELEMKSEWVREVGWEVRCTWAMLPNDTLQSVRLQKNGQQFMIYRPEIHGASYGEAFPTPEVTLGVQCVLRAEGGRKGECLLRVQPHLPPVADLHFSCEVSGERPTFIIERKDYVLKTLVSPSDAKLEREASYEAAPGRVMLNCSSTGLPAPTLQWTINQDQVQADFSGRLWNDTSKLWHVWSSLAHTRWQRPSVATCTPEVIYNHEVVKGTPVIYNNAMSLGAAKALVGIFTLLALRR